MRYIDLSVVINEQTPFYEGAPQPKIEEYDSIDEYGFSVHQVTMLTHEGTHIDAPSHMIPGGKTIDQYPISHFIGHGRYIKLQNKKYDMVQIRALDIHAGDIIVFHTGMEAVYGNPAYYSDNPIMPEEMARYLIDKKIRMVCFDSCGPDTEPYPLHKLFLGADVLIAENLTNLDELADKQFTIYAVPIKLQVDAAPARIIAEIKG